MKRKLPTLTNDKAAADFVATADLTTYDLSTLKPVQLELAAKEARLNMRLPGDISGPLMGEG